LDQFLERVALVSDQDTVDTSANVPTLLTLHAAKGLEFPVVFIVGLSEGTLPHSRSKDDEEELYEERRLFYVGITRAKDLLYLVYPLNRSSYGYAEPVERSSFLNDIPTDSMIEENVERVGRRIQTTPYRSDRWETPAASAPNKVQKRFPPGARIVHSVWGEGMVLASRIMDDEEIVDIYFENIGMKRVAASLAKLEIKS
jgi:DNA helicase-2/ATP-dependent DNA helicase PcrA